MRLRYGIEPAEGGSAGLELLAPMDVGIVDPFGSLFGLKTGSSIGAYFTIDSPCLSASWNLITGSEYTDVTSGASDKDLTPALDLRCRI